MYPMFRSLVGSMLCALVLAHSISPAKDVIRLPVPYIQQPNGETCLPTSLCMAMHYLGRCELTTDTIQSLHATCHYDRYNVPKLVERFGLHAFPSWLEHAWTRETVEAELRAGHPVILGLDCSRPGHFVLAVGYTDDGKVIIHDPYWKEPGWPFGGPFVTTDWAPLIWRNGIILHTDAFTSAPRAVSGNMTATTAPRTLVPGQQAVVEFAVKNNGTQPWPDEVYLAPVDAYSTNTQERASPFAIVKSDADTGQLSEAWVSQTRVGPPDKKALAPGDVAHFRAPIHAPALTEPTTFRENFNLVDGAGHWFSENWMTGPSNRQMFFRVAVVPKVSGADKLPLIETAEGGKLALPWRFKFPAPNAITPGEKPAAPAAENNTTNSLTPPDGSTVLKLRTPPGESFQVAFVGDPLARDYHVQAWVYCDYRPADKDRGYDRYGIFMHDAGQHRIGPKTELENDDCILISYDTDNGRVRCANFEKGGLADFRRESDATYIKQSGWHKMGIRAEGSTVTFELDDKPIHVARNVSSFADEAPTAFSSGDCGVYYRSAYPDEAERRGVQFAGFKMEQ